MLYYVYFLFLLKGINVKYNESYRKGINFTETTSGEHYRVVELKPGFHYILSVSVVSWCTTTVLNLSYSPSALPQ